MLHEMKPVSPTGQEWTAIAGNPATLQPGWHTFAMDNERRAAEKLAGKTSLGIDQPTQIKVSGGLR